MCHKILIFLLFSVISLGSTVLGQDVENASELNTKKEARISEKKCIEYSSAVYENMTLLGVLLNHMKKVVTVDRCTLDTTPLIVGGQNTKHGEFPHMAFIIVEDAISPTTCGGILISDEFVLTAAHCLTSGEVKGKHVILGLYKLDDDETHKFQIVQQIIHPNYDSSSSKYNDIALLKLNRKVQFTPSIRPACLPTKSENSTQAIASGWGNTAFEKESYSNILQKVKLDIFPHESCAQIYQNRKLSLPNGIQEETQICAGSSSSKKDTCQGDSGGPLQTYHLTQYCMYTIIGITSFGYKCGEVGVPGVYTRLLPYLTWIEQIVWQ